MTADDWFYLGSAAAWPALFTLMALKRCWERRLDRRWQARQVAPAAPAAPPAGIAPPGTPTGPHAPAQPLPQRHPATLPADYLDRFQHIADATTDTATPDGDPTP